MSLFVLILKNILRQLDIAFYYNLNCGYSLVVKFQPSKLAMWVRFPLPAPEIDQ